MGGAGPATRAGFISLALPLAMAAAAAGSPCSWCPNHRPDAGRLARFGSGAGRGATRFGRASGRATAATAALASCSFGAAPGRRSAAGPRRARRPPWTAPDRPDAARSVVTPHMAGASRNSAGHHTGHPIMPRTPPHRRRGGARGGDRPARSPRPCRGRSRRCRAGAAAEEQQPGLGPRPRPGAAPAAAQPPDQAAGSKTGRRRRTDGDRRRMPRQRYCGGLRRPALSQCARAPVVTLYEPRNRRPGIQGLAGHWPRRRHRPARERDLGPGRGRARPHLSASNCPTSSRT